MGADEMGKSVPAESGAAGATAGPAPADDIGPARRAMREEVARGLSCPQKQLSPKYFYDTRGSELFERITRTPEYYLTRTERTLLDRCTGPWFEEIRPAALVELGAGSARKTRILLDAMTVVGSGDLFIPLDVSGEFLLETADRLRSEYPGLNVEPEVADITEPLQISVPLPEPTLFALLGSTIGNFAGRAAINLLGHVRATMAATDRFLMGADLRPGPGKSLGTLEAAYNDARGVTAEFNLNILRVLNRELGADFDLSAFEHRAFYAAEEGRVEMHLRSLRPQVVTIPGAGAWKLEAGETIRTEISCKYDRDTVDELFSAAGLTVSDWCEDERGRFALVMGAPT